MRHPLLKRSLVALVLSAAVGLGCGSDPTASPQRIARQDQLSLSGTLSQYWLYSYDAAGFVTEVKAYSAADVLLNTAVHTNVGGFRTLTTTRDAAGALMGTTAYTYTSGVLSRADFLSAVGTLLAYNTFVFVDGRKLTTSRFSATDASTGRMDFGYDPASGRRMGGTSVDAAGAVNMTSTRTWVGDVWTQAQLDYPTSPSIIRRFTYEAGPLAIDPDIFFEF